MVTKNSARHASAFCAVIAVAAPRPAGLAGSGGKLQVGPGRLAGPLGACPSGPLHWRLGLVSGLSNQAFVAIVKCMPPLIELHACVRDNKKVILRKHMNRFP